MAKFKCNLSGNIFEFVHDFDVDEMRVHPQYTEVVEEDKVVQVKKTTKEKVNKKEAK